MNVPAMSAMLAAPADERVHANGTNAQVDFAASGFSNAGLPFASRVAPITPLAELPADARQRSSSPWQFKLGNLSARSGVSTPPNTAGCPGPGVIQRPPSGTRTPFQLSGGQFSSGSTYQSAVLLAVRKQLEAYEEKFNQQLSAMQTKADRLREATFQRIEDKVMHVDSMQPKLDRRVAELTGNYKGLSDEMQAQIRRCDLMDERNWEWRHQMEEATRQKQEAFEQRVQQLELACRVNSSALEEDRKRNLQRVQRLEQLQSERGQAQLDAQESIMNVHMRLEALEAASTTARVFDSPPREQKEVQQQAGSADLIALLEKRVTDNQEVVARMFAESHDLHSRLESQEVLLRTQRTLLESREEYWRSLGERLERHDWDAKLEQLRAAQQDVARRHLEHDATLQLVARRLDHHEQAQEELRTANHDIQLRSLPDLSQPSVLPSDIEELAGRFQELLSRVAQLETDVGSNTLAIEVDLLAQKLNSMMPQLRENSENIRELRDLHVTATSRGDSALSQVEARLSDCHQQVSVAELPQLKNRVEELEQRLQQHASAMEQLAEGVQSDTLSTEVVSLMQRLSFVPDAVREFHDQLDISRGRSDTLEARFNDELLKLRSQVEDLAEWRNGGSAGEVSERLNGLSQSLQILLPLVAQNCVSVESLPQQIEELNSLSERIEAVENQLSGRLDPILQIVRSLRDQAESYEDFKRTVDDRLFGHERSLHLALQEQQQAHTARHAVLEEQQQVVSARHMALEAQQKACLATLSALEELSQDEKLEASMNNIASRLKELEDDHQTVIDDVKGFRDTHMLQLADAQRESHDRLDGKLSERFDHVNANLQEFEARFKVLEEYLAGLAGHAASKEELSGHLRELELQLQPQLDDFAAQLHQLQASQAARPALDPRELESRFQRLVAELDTKQQASLAAIPALDPRELESRLQLLVADLDARQQASLAARPAFDPGELESRLQRFAAEVDAKQQAMLAARPALDPRELESRLQLLVADLDAKQQASLAARPALDPRELESRFQRLVAEFDAKQQVVSSQLTTLVKEISQLKCSMTRADASEDVAHLLVAEVSELKQTMTTYMSNSDASSQEAFSGMIAQMNQDMEGTLFVLRRDIESLTDLAGEQGKWARELQALREHLRRPASVSSPASPGAVDALEARLTAEEREEGAMLETLVARVNEVFGQIAELSVAAHRAPDNPQSAEVAALAERLDVFEEQFLSLVGQIQAKLLQVNDTLRTFDPGAS